MAVPATLTAAGARNAGESGLEQLLPHLFRNAEDARAIGRTYLRRQAEPRPATRSASDLASMLDRPDVRSPAQLRARVSDLIRRDFVNNDVVIVDGWILARTEAQICALLAA